MFLSYSFRLIAVVLVISFFGGGVQAKTWMSQMVEKVQKKYADQITDYPIVIFDRDELHWRFAKEKAFGDSEQVINLRKKVIRKYVQEKVNVELTGNEAGTVEPYLSGRVNGALAYPFGKEYFSPEYKICLVLPLSFNSNEKIETERLLQLSLSDVYGQKTYEQLRYNMSYEELALFSLYHELSHCLDKTFLPEINSGNHGLSATHTRHQAESFAEALAFLLLFQEGNIRGELAKVRAIFRQLYSFQVGQFMARNPQNSFGDPGYMKAGSIYYLAPVLYRALEEAKWNKKVIKEENLGELVERATRISQDFALSGRSFAAISYLLENGSEKSLPMYKKQALDMPEFFYATYKDLLFYNDFSTYVVSEAFQSSPVDLSEEGALADYDESIFCSSYKKGNKGEFFSYLSFLREDLRSMKGTADDQKARVKTLDQVFAKVSELCL